jgi:hypothetical protein
MGIRDRDMERERAREIETFIQFEWVIDAGTVVTMMVLRQYSEHVAATR